MIFPIGDENVSGGSKPYLSYSFIAINLVIFFFQVSMEPSDLNRFILDYGTRPAYIVQGNDYFTLLTSMFLHGGWMHVLGNMLFLWIFADNIEAVIGNSRFLVFYLAGGVVATVVHILFNAASEIPSIGASGAISALMGAYLVMFPKSRIKVLFFFRVIYVAAVVFLGFWIGQQLLAGVNSVRVEAGAAGGVAWWAHIGGFVFGIISGFIFRKWGLMDGVYRYDELPD